MSLFLTDADLIELTRKQRPHAQVKVLRALGIEHRVRPDNSLLVSRSHVELVLSGKHYSTLPTPEPSWDALRGVRRPQVRLPNPVKNC